jgi:hypothetical protein
MRDVDMPIVPVVMAAAENGTAANSTSVVGSNVVAAGVAEAARPCNAWGIALITREPFATVDCVAAAA